MWHFGHDVWGLGSRRSQGDVITMLLTSHLGRPSSLSAFYISARVLQHTQSKQSVSSEAITTLWRSSLTPCAITSQRILSENFSTSRGKKTRGWLFEKHLYLKYFWEQKHFGINVKWRVWRIKAGFIRACFDKLCDSREERSYNKFE